MKNSLHLTSFQTKRLLRLQWNEKPQDQSDRDATEFLVEVDTALIVEEPCQKLSLNAMNNNTSASNTIKFIGSINKHSVKIMLDEGSDDNFIQPRIAQFLQSDIQPTNPFKALVGNMQSL